MGASLREVSSSRFRIPDSEGLAAWIDADLKTMGDDWVVFVAEDGARLVGELEARVHRVSETARYQLLTDLARVRGEITYLGVAPTHRRRGLARRLLGVAEAWLVERGAEVIRLDTFIDSPESVPLYESSGYRRAAVVFERRPERPTDRTGGAPT